MKLFMKNVISDISVKRYLWQVYFLISILILMSLGMVIPTSAADSTNVNVTVEWEVFFGNRQKFGSPANDAISTCIQTSDGGFAALVTTEYTYTTLVKFTANGQQEWNTTFPGAFDPCNLVQTSDNGFVFQSIIGKFGQDADVYLQKINSIGQPVWNSTFGGDQSDWICSMILVEDGGFILAGGTNYSNTWWDHDMWLVKTDSLGVPEWNRTLGGDDPDLADSVIQTIDGGYAVIGKIGTGGDWLIKTDVIGQPEWHKSFDYNLKPSCLIQISDGSYVLGGTNWNGLVSNYYHLKTDSNGNQVWSYSYNTFHEDEDGNLRDLIQTIDNGYLLAGDTGATYDSDHDLWFIKTDSNGIHQWNTTFGGSGDQWLNSIIPMSDGGFVIAGTSQPPGKTDTDMWLLKVSVSDKRVAWPGVEFSLVVLFLVLPLFLSRKRRH